MNSLLVNNRPEGCTKEEFVKMWNNAGYTLEALHKLLTKWVEENDRVKADDFDCPNHYQKMVYQQGKKQAFEEVLALLPESLRS